MDVLDKNELSSLLTALINSFCRGRRTTTTTQRYDMACWIYIKKLCMQHLYSLVGWPYYRVWSSLSTLPPGLIEYHLSVEIAISV